MTLAWERRIGTSPSNTGKVQCIASSAYDGKFLYVAAAGTVIGGKSYLGSNRRVDPATSAVLVQTGLPNAPLGTAGLHCAAVPCVGTYGCSPTPEPVSPLDRQTRPI